MDTGHNILMIGAPGAGKTMLAPRIPSHYARTYLPPKLNTTMSVWGIL